MRSEPTHRERVPDALDGERLDRVVAMVTGESRAAVRALVEAGAVRVDGVVSGGPAERVRAGGVVEVDVPAATSSGSVAADPVVDVPVVHADDHVIVVDKPAGLVVHPGAGRADGTLVQGILARFPEVAAVGDPARPGIVHRLDRGTSGLLVVAHSPEAYDDLVDQLGHRRVTREYLALVWGRPEAPVGLVDAPIGRSAREPTRMVSNRGREARTGYEVVESHDEPEVTALVRCHLETGRTHQIRVHLAAIGHPVVGDERYGGDRPAIALDRPFLHATHLAFAHPISGEELAFDSPLPPDLSAVLDRLAARS
jgi:23S rRNA pseudouridine1911/1915/1917 synthase